MNSVSIHCLVTSHEAKVISLHISNDSIEVLLLTEDNSLITRAGRLLSAAESNYTLIEKQLLALQFAINKFRLLLHPKKIKIRVPNKDLEKTLNLVNC